MAISRAQMTYQLLRAPESVKGKKPDTVKTAKKAKPVTKKNS